MKRVSLIISHHTFHTAGTKIVGDIITRLNFSFRARAVFTSLALFTHLPSFRQSVHAIKVIRGTNLTCIRKPKDLKFSCIKAIVDVCVFLGTPTQVTCLLLTKMHVAAN